MPDGTKPPVFNNNTPRSGRLSRVRTLRPILPGMAHRRTPRPVAGPPQRPGPGPRRKDGLRLLRAWGTLGETSDAGRPR